ncbi:MAG TPA: DUF5916 domain-containing protein [Longimicrobium sp.]|jgi:hypothetical protein
MRSAAALAGVLAFLPIHLTAQATPESARPTLRVTRAEAGIRIDGRLDDPAWAAAETVSAFTQNDPEEGLPASEATTVRIVYDDEALYVGVRLHDRGEISTRLGRRDMGSGDSDWFGLVVDSYHDHQTAFSFQVNPSGVRRDAARTDTTEDLSWDAVWQAETTRDSAGWSAEYRIPFSQVRFNSRNETWGIQMERIIGRRNEYAVFAFTPKRERAGIARFGHLEGMRDVRTGKRLEILPYTVARAEYIDPGANPFRTRDEYSTSAGLDVKYRITSNLTMDATLNPDFGQVEVDPAVVNLSALETVLEEKRPFFVEGSEIFRFGGGALPTGGGLFYSRRIGGRFSPLVPPTVLADVPRETRILGAAKLTGKTPGGWSIGMLDAVTDREEARFRDSEGDHALVVEPRSNFFVGRLRREMHGGRSYVGGMLTSVNRSLETEELCAVFPFLAVSGGLDFAHQFANRRWALSGFAALGGVRGDTLALTRVQRRPYRLFERPDADHLELDRSREALAGVAAELRLRKQAGAHWRGGAAVATISPEFESSELGSQRRADRIDATGDLTYLQQKPGNQLRSYQLTARLRREWAYDGEHNYSSYVLSSSAQHRNYWAGELQLGASPRTTDDRLTRGGPLAARPGFWRVSAGLNSDQRKPLVGNAGVFFQDDDAGGRILEALVNVQVKGSPRWNLTVGPYLSRTVTSAQYLASVADMTESGLYGRRYIFAGLNQTTASLNARFNYTFNPDLTLEVFAQPFVSGVDFGESKYLLAPRTLDFAPDASGAVTGTDFNIRSLRGNGVLRWEWRPGTTLYLAWQQQRESYTEEVGDFRFRRDQDALFRTRPDNVFVMKVNYWINQ